MKTRTRIKICGITDAEEALAIALTGVDGLGFIFAKSPRRITPDQARSIRRLLPPLITTVGLFIDEQLDRVEEIGQYVGLSLVQLHGAEPPEYCARLSFPVVKSFRIRPETRTEELAPYEGRVAGFLFDTFSPHAAGGTGKTFDWDLVGRLHPPGPYIMAGGLTPGNVGEAIRRTRPWAVDANSGVEVSPGRKDIAKVRELVAAVGVADSST